MPRPAASSQARPTAGPPAGSSSSAEPAPERIADAPPRSTAAHAAHRGRGALSNPAPRYLAERADPCDDGWPRDEPPPARPPTELHPQPARRVISYNQSPDVRFDRSINPYRGCEHGCIYCYARPTHAYLDLSPGMDFETRLFYKADAAERLRAELAAPSYRCAPLVLGANTDAYQPVERKQMVTRDIVETLDACRHPVRIVTKSALVERDLDILARMAARRLAEVWVSVTTLDRKLSRLMEPRASAPHRRLQTIAKLAAQGVPTGVLVAPVIPYLNDNDLEKILKVAREAGASGCGYVLLRLPREVGPLFTEWLEEHYPLRAQRILGRLRDSHGGREYNAQFGARMRGRGLYADLIAARFRRARQKLGYAPMPELDCAAFRPPRRGAAAGQRELFDASG